MKEKIQAITLLDRVALVTLKSNPSYTAIRFDKLDVEDNGEAFLNCSIRRTLDEIGTEAPILKRKINVNDFSMIQFLDTEKQQRLRKLNALARMIDLNQLTEEERAVCMDRFSHMFTERAQLLEENVVEFQF